MEIGPIELVKIDIFHYLGTLFVKISKLAKISLIVAAQLTKMNQIMKLCQGIKKDSLTGQDCLIDYLNDNLTARSFKCKFVISPETESSCCEECQKLVAIKKEVELIRNNEDCTDSLQAIKASLKKEDGIINAANLLIGKSHTVWKKQKFYSSYAIFRESNRYDKLV